MEFDASPEQQLKEKTLGNVISIIGNKNISTMIVDYLVMTCVEFVEIHRNFIDIKIGDKEHPPSYSHITTPGIKCMPCDWCSHRMESYYYDQNLTQHRLIPSCYNVCENCVPFVICSVSQHLEDFRRHIKFETSTYCFDRNNVESNVCHMHKVGGGIAVGKLTPDNGCCNIL